MIDLKRIASCILATVILGALFLAACKPAAEPAAPAATSAGLTQVQAEAICSTLAVARNMPDFNSLANALAENVVSNDPFSTVPMKSLEEYKQFILGTHAAFPDFSIRYNDIRVSGDRIYAHWTAAGTHKGTWYDLSPTGKNVTISGIAVLTVDGGKVTEQSNFFDLLAVARQLGATLAMPGAAGTGETL